MKLTKITLLASLAFSLFSATAIAQSKQDQLVGQLLGQIQKAVLASKNKNLKCHSAYFSGDFLNNKKFDKNLEINGYGFGQFFGGRIADNHQGWHETYYGAVVAQVPDGTDLFSLGFSVEITKDNCQAITKVPATIKIFNGAASNVIGTASFEIEP
jgi:hypothetical protein